MNRQNKPSILVTGGAGFIGSAVVEELVVRGAEVIVYDNFKYGKKSNLLTVKNKVTVVHGNILDPDIHAVMVKNHVTQVIHLVAEPFVPDSYTHPETVLEVNIKGTLNMLSAARRLKIKRVIYVSSSEVYGEGIKLPMNETHPTNPQSVYAVSKLAADRLCSVFARAYGLPVIVARCFNCYGPRPTHPNVIPEIISQFMKGKRLILGNLEAKRDFTYVDDTANALADLLSSDVPHGECVNIGTGKSYSVLELAERIGVLMGHGRPSIKIDSARLRPLDILETRCDSSKLMSHIRWRPKIDLTSGLRKTIRWFTTKH